MAASTRCSCACWLALKRALSIGLVKPLLVLCMPDRSLGWRTEFLMAVSRSRAASAFCAAMAGSDACACCAYGSCGKVGELQWVSSCCADNTSSLAASACLAAFASASLLSCSLMVISSVSFIS
eukprot:1183345-Prorocentrum_minimum.AAC.5